MQYGPWRAKSGAAQREGKVLSQKTNKQKSFIRSSSERAQGNGADTEDKKRLLGEVVHDYNPRIWKAETDELL